MCGIAGIVRRKPGGSDLNLMMSRLAHRGPDGNGTWQTTTVTDWQIQFGHQRLSIIDHAGGRQPMSSEDQACNLTFNGEIYNFQLLRHELERQGHHFKTHSDTEAVLHHLGEYGADGLPALNGMFALGFWNDRTQELTLARDRTGIKPLYYAQLPCGGIAFASELFALLACDGVGTELDARGLASLFFRDYVEPPHTIIRGVKKLPPGNALTWSAGETGAARPFWTMADIPERRGEDNSSTLTAELSRATEAAVVSQLVADVPVGVFLSGGIDSSLVAAFASRHVGPSLQTFSISFDDPDYDESMHARHVARHLGTRHTERQFSEPDLLEGLEGALNCLDEPMADPSVLPTYLLSSIAAEHVKVALGGDGGDELWAGYPTYWAHRAAGVYAAVPSAIRRKVLEPLVGGLPLRQGYQTLEWKLKRFVGRFADDPIKCHQQWMSNVSPADLQQAVAASPPWLQDLCFPPAADSDPTNRLLALDFQSYLPGSVLTKVDRASMAHGLEVRPPLLDNTLIDFAFGLSSHWKLRGRSGKWLLKQVAEPLLPRSIIQRKKKGFGIPLARWIGTVLDGRLREVLAESPLWSTGLLCQRTFTTWHGEHLSRRVDHSRALWALLVLDHFYRRIKASRT